MEILRHDAETGCDDPAGIPAIGEDIDRGGRAHADDDRRCTRDELGADTIGESVLADFGRLWVIKAEALHVVVTQMIERSAATQERRRDRRGHLWDNARERDTLRRMGSEQRVQGRGLERSGG